MDDSETQASATPIPDSMPAEDFLEEGAGDATHNGKEAQSDGAHAKIDGGAKALREKQKALLPKSVLDD